MLLSGTIARTAVHNYNVMDLSYDIVIYRTSRSNASYARCSWFQISAWGRLGCGLREFLSPSKQMLALTYFPAHYSVILLPFDSNNRSCRKRCQIQKLVHETETLSTVDIHYCCLSLLTNKECCINYGYLRFMYNCNDVSCWKWAVTEIWD